jgi:hypothetical protein
MEPNVIEAGPNQAIVLYVSDDTGAMVDPPAIWGWVGNHAKELSAQGWRIVSATVMPMRQMGTAGNIFFQSGGQFSTQLTVAVVYAK